LDRVVSPHERNGVGSVRLAGAKAMLPLRVQEATFAEEANGFEARLTVDHGKVIRAQLRFRSELDGSFLMVEKLVALTNVTTAEVATGLIGILNNPHWIYERGKRQVTADDKVIEAASGKGQRWQWEAVRRILVDDVYEVRSERPLRAAYVAADRPERGRVTDKLILNQLPDNRTWAAGETLSDFQVIIRCATPRK
jgi:hypothetical protein